MSRIGIIVELEEQERRKIEFEKVLHDLEDFYCEGASIQFHIKSKAFDDRRKYQGSNIEIDKTLMKTYIAHEIEKLDIAITENIEKLGSIK